MVTFVNVMFLNTGRLYVAWMLVEPKGVPSVIVPPLASVAARTALVIAVVVLLGGPAAVPDCDAKPLVSKFAGDRSNRSLGLTPNCTGGAPGEVVTIGPLNMSLIVIPLL